MLDRGNNIKLDKIVESAIYIEGVVQKRVNIILTKNKKTANHITVVEKMLQESRIRPFGLTLNIYIYLIVTFSCIAFVFNLSFDLLNNYTAAVILAGVAAVAPYELLKLEVGYKRRSIRKYLPNFFLTLSQLLEAIDDIMEVLESTVTKIKGPVRKPVKELVENYNTGKPIEVCIAIFKSRFDNPIIIKFADDVESNVLNGTHIRGSIEELTIKAYNNEISYLERITENSGNLSGAIGVFTLFLYLIFQLNKIQPSFANILKYNPYGQILVVILIVLILIATLIMKYSVSYKDK